VLLAAAASAQEQPDAATFTRIEAVRSTWHADSPPESGWVPVSLPDEWSSRWPDFDGVVWYRLSWQREDTDAGQPVALLLAYLNMAGAVYLNGSLLMRDESLVEPLTRAWNTPRYQLLPPGLLREGTNTLLIRVSGLSAYQPGLGPVSVADPDSLRAAYDRAYWLRHDLQLISLAVTVALGCFFLSLWLMRRQEVAYGWFSVMSLAWWCVALNQVATSTWPFGSNDAWERANTIALLVYSVAYTMSMARFCERRLPRIESVLWLLAALGAAVMLWAPAQSVAQVRGALTMGAACNFFATCVVFLGFAWRSGRTDHRILSFCIAIFLAAAVHDLLSFLGILTDNLYYAALTSQAQMIAMALVLASRFVANLRRIERFNDELHGRIATARAELAANLDRQREFEVANARLNERLNLAHDLHDGLGGTLVSGIATLERISHDVPPGQVLSILKELRDDLRIIIDATASEQFGEHALAGQIVPLRHRLTRLLESHGIDCRWHLGGLEQCYLPTSQILDVMRTLQEALTNVMKHSDASRADVVLRIDARGLELVVSDNGPGFDPAAIERHPGTGMRSMRARTQRLGGTFSVRSAEDGTVLTVHIPIGASTAGLPLDLQSGRGKDRVPDPGVAPRGPDPANFAIETDSPVQRQG